MYDEENGRAGFRPGIPPSAASTVNARAFPRESRVAQRTRGNFLQPLGPYLDVGLQEPSSWSERRG